MYYVRMGETGGIPNTDGIQAGSGKPAESLNGKIYFDIASSNIKSSEKIYFNV